MTSTLTSVLQALRITPATATGTNTIPSVHAPYLPKRITTNNNNNSSNKNKKEFELSSNDDLVEIPLSEVAMHDAYEDCWVVIYDRVYDLTDFLDSHPGGGDVIMDHAGRDATLAFHGTGHSKDAIKQMRDYLIGELPPKERIFRTTNYKILTLDVPE